MSSTPPTTVIRDGNLKASIWQNEGEKGTYFTTILAKTYRDQDGNLRDTNAFNSNDLLGISELAREARSRTRELRQDLSPSHRTEQTPELTPERSSERAPEQSADGRQAHLSTYQQERREERSLEPEYEMDR